MTALTDKLKAIKPAPAREPLWRGPSDPGPNGGITFSLLSRFQTCRERFRLHAVEGLRPAERFNHRIEYGQMWHVCEEALAEVKAKGPEFAAAKSYGDGCWTVKLQPYAQELCHKYPMEQEQINHWYQVCRTQFPLYVTHWAEHPDVTARTPLLQEQVFDVPYRLPSGRTVRLRGKWDSVDLVGKGKAAGVWLMENKTKGDIDEEQTQRQLTGDLQTMMYLIALNEGDALAEYCEPRGIKIPLPNPIQGVRYNVIRRPLSGGRGTIVQKKGSKNVPAETKAEYYARLAAIIKEEPEHYFMRWTALVGPEDLARFRRRTLDPILEQLCDWWEWILSPTGRLRPFAAAGDEEENCDEINREAVKAKRLGGSVEEVLLRPHPRPCHWQHPFGVKNTIDEYGSSDLDNYLCDGSEVGLRRADELFTELK